jgi:hypothetical protein
MVDQEFSNSDIQSDKSLDEEDTLVTIDAVLKKIGNQENDAVDPIDVANHLQELMDGEPSVVTPSVAQNADPVPDSHPVLDLIDAALRDGHRIVLMHVPSTRVPVLGMQIDDKKFLVVRRSHDAAGLGEAIVAGLEARTAQSPFFDA